MWDNRIFNINGKGDEMLLDTLRLVFKQNGFGCSGWKFSIDHGLILTWHVDKECNINAFPEKLNADQCLPIVSSWLKGKEAKTVKHTLNWDMFTDHDGSNSEGWRVYCEDWGHVAGLHIAICAIKPVTLWYGK
jgi:hypothetical protein